MMLNQAILAFISGLTNGGISCTTVQGGLLTVAVADGKSKLKNTTLFLISKIIFHTILGGMLGLLGSFFTFSFKLQGVLQIIVGIFMILTAIKISGLVKNLNLIEFHLPDFLKTWFNNISKKYPNTKPIILGASTIFIPCGATQAMSVLAIGSGSVINGALIMFSFVLGTTPLFFAIGLTIGQFFKFNILKNIATIILLIIGVTSINNGQVLRGSLHTLQNYYDVIFEKNTSSRAPIIDNTQVINITATNSGYELSNKTVKIGVPVKLIVQTENLYSCASTFVIPSMNINEKLPSSGQKVIEFTPDKLGPLTFSCSMGMFADTITVVE